MDLESRIQVNFLRWIRRILNEPYGTSAEFVRGLLGEEKLTLLLGAKRPLPTLTAPFSPFYAQVLRFWAKVHGFPPIDEEGIKGRCCGIISEFHLLRTCSRRQVGGDG